MVWKACATYDEDEDSLRTLRKFRLINWILPFCLAGALLIPSKSTIIGMIIADKITYNSVNQAIETSKDIKNEIKKDILDIINSINKEEKKK